MNGLDTVCYMAVVAAMIYICTLLLRWMMRNDWQCPKCKGRMDESYIVPGTWFCRNRDCGTIIQTKPKEEKGGGI